MPEYCHLHCHTQYSLLDGAAEIGTMMDKAAADGQKGVALTDHGNMFGAFKFVAEAEKRDIKPIIGCEFYLVEDRHKKSFSRAQGEKDKRYHQLLLAKNQKGYENISKLCSLGFIEGAYGKFPRIDKELIEKYHEGVIVTSCCIGAIIPQLLLQGKDDEAEKELKWWLNIFGDDYYIELQRHRGLDNIDIGKDKDGKPIFTGLSQEDINQKLLILAEKNNVKVICTNDSHYVEEEDFAPHDILLCINTNSLIDSEKRFKFPSSDFYFKTQAQMSKVFHDQPQALDNTMEIFSKIEKLTLARDVLLPNFPMPKEFKTQDDYLRHLTYLGAQRRYKDITPAIKERLDFELEVIRKSGYPGYFLIVQDFTTVAREMNVSVGPGRGSAAGSAVAYCIGITNVDPIKYDLLFERFLNPERVSMPDIDIDFDDEGRQRVIDYVIDKYGQNQVAQIITYGTMAARSSLRDVGRVMDIPLQEVDQVAKTFPTHLKASLAKVLSDDDIDAKLKGEMNSDDRDKAYAFRKLSEGNDKIGDMIQTAKKLEGSIRNTGIHACGVVITPDEITKYVPVTADKETGMLISQFDNSVAEDAGLLKMDFLGLKTLTIIKNAVAMVKENYGIELVADEFPLDDEKTYELFQRGETVGIFQYESTGMQKYLKELVPTTFADIIAMNALYRPGPLEYIPNFVARKHGREPVTYDLPDMKEYLEETYGINVYQEQIMLLSQKLAGFTKGEADMLRKAMGKKKKALLDKMLPKFISGGEERGHPEDILKKVWKDWEAFASYAFNKSHSTCYAFVAFQTAYLKAHYPGEFMSAVLTNSKSDISKITFFLQECKRMGLDVLGPDINESVSDFSVNKKGQIRFGMSALKGVGEGPVEGILKEREAGKFEGVFSLLTRLEQGVINKRVLESLALGGAFDCFGEITRPQYFAPSEKYDTYIEHLVKYATAYKSQKASAAGSLFGAIQEEIMVQEPEPPTAREWSLIEKLDKEKTVTGIYISGHPLDDYRLEVSNFVTCNLTEIDRHKQRGMLQLAGSVNMARHMISKNGNGWGIFAVADYGGEMEFRLFGEDYQKFKHLLEPGKAIFIKGNFQKSWRDDGLEFRIKDIKLLESVGESMTQGITINIQLDKLSEEMVNELAQVCSLHKGKHKLRMMIIDRQKRIKLALAAKEKRIHADNDFVKKLQKLGLEYKLETTKQ